MLSCCLWQELRFLLSRYMSCVHACVLRCTFFANSVPCAAGDGVYNSLACLADIRVPLPEGEVASAEASLAAAGMFCPHHLCACHVHRRSTAPFLRCTRLCRAAEERPHVVVREEWPGDERGDLPLRVGDVVILLSDAGNGWYEGKIEPGNRAFLSRWSVM